MDALPEAAQDGPDCQVAEKALVVLEHLVENVEQLLFGTKAYLRDAIFVLALDKRLQ